MSRRLNDRPSHFGHRPPLSYNLVSDSVVFLANLGEQWLMSDQAFSDDSSERSQRTLWPAARGCDAGQRRGACLVANFNTRELIAGLLFSLYRLLGKDQFTTIVVVDNHSQDGSLELLNACADAGLLHLIRNPRQQYHGPALNQGISWLAQQPGQVLPEQAIDYVWVLDSDVIILRPDTVSAAVTVLENTGAAAVGQLQYDQWNKEDLAGLHSVLLDPALTWTTTHPPFLETGDPSTALQQSLRQQGLAVVDFPYCADSYILHLGRGTLRVVAQSNLAANKYFNWATEHYEYHYGGNPQGPQLHRAFLELFSQAGLSLSPASLVAACQRPGLLSIPTTPVG